MGMLSNILREGVQGRLSWWCPGCSMAHQIHTDGPNAYEWNGDAEMPSFSTSVMVRWSSLSHEAEKRNVDFKAKHGRWMTAAELPYDQHYTCHCFVRNGQIEFLGDCTHELKGQTVPIPDWPKQRWE